MIYIILCVIIIFLIGVIIIYRKKVQEEMKQLEFQTGQTDLLIEEIPGGVHRCDIGEHPHVLFLSKGFTQITGYTLEMLEEEHGGLYIGMCYDLEDIEIVASSVQDLISGKKQNDTLIYRMRHRDGHMIWISENVVSYRNVDGGLEAIAVILDITEQMKKQDEFEKLSTMVKKSEQ